MDPPPRVYVGRFISTPTYISPTEAKLRAYPLCLARALWLSWGAWRFLMSEVPLYALTCFLARRTKGRRKQHRHPRRQQQPLD